MPSIDILGFILSLLGIYSLIFYVRYLLPRYNIPSLSTSLDETQQLLDHAEEICAVQPESDYRAHLYLSTNQFAMMRIESNHAQGVFQQLRIAMLHGLTCRLYTLHYRIEAIKSRLELAVDERQIQIAIMESATRRAVVPIPAAVTVTPVRNVLGPTLPLPATAS